MILCPMCAEFHDARNFVLKDRQGATLNQRNPLPVDELLPHLPSFARQWLHNRRVANARQRLEAGANWQCPRGHQLPDDFADTRTIVIGLIGSPQTSKTTYLGRLVSEIVDHARLSPLGIHCTLADDDSQDYYNQYMAVPLEQGMAPATTQPLTGEATTRPLIVRMTTPGQRFNVLFFDASGENTTSAEVLARHNPYIHALNAAIVFVTPRALTELPAGYPLTGREAAGPRQMHQVVTNLDRVLTAHPSFQGSHPRRDLPIALVLAKCDELDALLQARESGAHRFGSLVLDHRLFDGMQQKLDAQGDLPYDILTTYGARGIVEAVFNLTDVRSVHAVSAMGCPPDPTGRFAPAQPVNVIEPLLAVLWALRIVGDRDVY
jgi:hypothetical protein